jgi:sporulation protein YhbH
MSKRRGYRMVGIRVRLDKHRTVKSRVKRKLAAQRRMRNAALDDLNAPPETADPNDDGPEARASAAALQEADEQRLETDGGAPRGDVSPKRFPFHTDDLVYRHITTDVRRESNAVVMCIMDTSGSMDTMKKYLARSFFFLLYQFIATKYRSVEIVFISHHTEAHEVTEEEFFHKCESGGTFISSGYQKALDIVAERYHPSLWNIYAFHCSDGDNFDSDNPAALRGAKELADVCNLFGYGEIKPMGSRAYESSMLNVFRRLDAENFQTVLIERKEDVWPSFKALLAKDRLGEAATA